MPGAHVQVSLRDAMGAAGSDYFVNTFNVPLATPLTLAQATQIAADIAGFYTHTNTNTKKISDYLSETIDGSALAHGIKVYDVQGSELEGPGNPLGSPLYQGTFTCDPSDATAPLPNEVAVCVTLEGTGRAAAQVESGGSRPKQRHTGRFYLGPLNTDAIYPGGAGETAMVHPTMITTINQAVQWLHDQMQANGAQGLGVWSRKNATMYPLEACSVDRSFDIVRSRGTAPQQRTRASIS